MTALKVGIFLLLVFLVVSVQPLIVVANFSPSSPFIEILSPRDSGYTTSEFLLNVTVKVYYDPSDAWERRLLVYSLDGGETVPINSSYHGVFWNSAVPNSFVTGEVVVSGVSDGPHSLTVYVKYNNTYTLGSQTIHFTAGSPTVTINVPPENSVDKMIPYSINVSAPHAWFINNQIYGKFISVGYSLDDASPVLVADELSIHGLSAGSRSIIFTGNLSAVSTGNHELNAYVTWAHPKDASPITTISEICFFSVGSQPVQQSDSRINFLTIAVVLTVIVFLLVLIISLLIYRKRRQKTV